jgi:endonuclease-3
MKETDPLPARARRLARGLARLYPDVACPLRHANPMQLLVATILSAQCTDARVNKVTPALFARYPDAADFAAADPEELQEYIKSTGFFRNKTRNILECAKQIMERHNGEVPRTMAELVKLMGIGRKTANVILGNAFDVPGIPVDTHVIRLSRRMGLTSQKNPVKIERDLMALVPRKEWSRFGLRMIFHGRRVCRARRPRCDECALAPDCPKIGVAPSGTGVLPVLHRRDAGATT